MGKTREPNLQSTCLLTYIFMTGDHVIRDVSLFCLEVTVCREEKTGCTLGLKERCDKFNGLLVYYKRSL